MTTATIKTKAQDSTKPSRRKVITPVSRRKGGAGKTSLWKTITIFLIFAGLVAYMFSPNVPNSQGSGTQSSADGGFVNSLAK